jgi:hypothetical protein
MIQTIVIRVVRRWFIVSALLLFLFPLPTRAGENTDTRQPWFLHLNGIGGERVVDHTLITGLRTAGFAADYQIYDWTGGETGITALQRRERHPEEARKVADLILKQFKAHPSTPIYLSCHSGGTAIVTWALELLPDDVKVEAVLMFAPALSPEYDLSKALRHVNKNVYVFSSPHDFVVLSHGTKIFGTMDGVRCDAAGLKGFVQPATGDETQYKKIIAQPYQRAWAMRYGNVGSHICGMRTRFVREYVSKILATGKIPVDEDSAASPATRPSEAKASIR